MSIKEKKAIQLLNFFAQKEGGKINRMKALKLIWLADRLHLREHGRTVSRMDDYFAMKYGPVSSKTTDLSRTKIDPYVNEYILPEGELNLISIKEPDMNVFSETDIEIIEQIYNMFGSQTQFNLSDFSHLFPEWKRYEKDIKERGGSYAIVMEDFFENPPKELSPLFQQAKEHIAAVRSLFEDFNQIAKA